MLGAAPTVEMEITRTACAGAATAFLLRRLGKNAGAYSPETPGIVDRVLFELGTASQGADLMRVARWFAERTGELARLGHRYGARLVAFRTGSILEWVSGGQGHRGAVLVTSGEILQPGTGISAPHALANAWDPRARGRGRDALVAVDPWPGMGRIAPLPPTLENAHKRCLNRAFLVYSYGWS
jgi:hypothetical protein